MNLSFAWLAQFALLVPFLAVPGILLARRYPDLREAVSLVSGALMLVLLVTLYGRLDTESAAFAWLEILPGLALAFDVDALGLLFALLAAFLWPVTIVYAIGYMRGHGEANQTRFYSLFSVSIGAAIGIAFAANLFTLYIFYEVLTLSTYPLVTHAGTDKARRGGRVYIALLLGSSILFFLPALIGTWAVAGTLDFRNGGIFDDSISTLTLSFLLVFFVLGIGKAAIMPLHRWLPAAMVAPTPVSALLHAVAVVKAGVFSLIKVCVFIFGLDTLAELPVTTVLLYMAGFSILAASLVAMYQDNLKARLAYSTISQLGYISLGVLTAAAAGVTGSVLHIVMHAFGKITLFFCAGAILVAAHETEISRMAGLGRRMPITMGAFLLASLSIAGLPPTGGTWSKWFLLTGTLDTQHWLLMALLLVSSLLNIAYLLPIPLRGFFGGTYAGDMSDQAATGSPESPGSDSDPRNQGNGVCGSIREAPWPMTAMLVLTALACVVLFFVPGPLFDIASSVGGMTGEIAEGLTGE